MTKCQMIDAIKKNYPPESYSMLREALDHCIGLLEAEAEDRLLVLPCRIGEDIYTVVTTDRRRGSRPCKHLVRHVRFGQLSWNNLRTVVVEFGKSVFLTREEAAEALRKEQKKEDE